MQTDQLADILEQIEKLSVRTEAQFEYIDNQIVPKEDSHPLSPEIIDHILSDDFDLVKFLTQYDMLRTSLNHRKIISQLTALVHQQISLSTYGVYVNDAVIKAKYFGGLYIPDMTFSLLTQEKYDTSEALLNPTSIIEVLSPSTVKKDRNQKKEIYQSIPSLQEYILIAQDSYKMEQFLRERKTNWVAKVYDSADQTCVLTVGVQLKLSDVYSQTKWGKKM